MIVDTSALLAIIFAEPEAVAFMDAILAEGGATMSAASYLEAALRLDRRLGMRDPDLDAMIEALAIDIVPVSVEHGRVSRVAAIRFGGAPAGLNFGDCLTYALAKTSGEPLLFKGKDFNHTDLPLATAA